MEHDNQRESGIRDLERLYTKQEVACYLKISVRTVDREIARLGLQVYKVGRSVRIPESTLIMMMQDPNETSTDFEPQTVSHGIQPAV